jgi:signal peptidase I
MENFDKNSNEIIADKNPDNQVQPVKENVNEMTTKQRIIYEVKSISLIIFLVLVFRSVFYEPFRIPSGSMIPTLMIGDYILVNKYAYGFKIPFSDWYTDPVYISEMKSPKRGEVIVFKSTKEKDMNLIKRVVAVEGDTLEVRNKVIYVNDVPINHKEIDGKKIMSDMDDKFKNLNFKFYQSKIGDNEYVYQNDEDNFYKVDFEKVTVPKGHLFVMGDNRDFSYDSRFWGFVPHQNIKGKAILVWFSAIFPFSDDEAKIRPHRIGTPIK